MDFWIRGKNQAVEVPNITKGDESKTKLKVKVMLLSSFDVRGYRWLRVLVTMLDDQSASLQEDSREHPLLSARVRKKNYPLYLNLLRTSF